MTKAKDVMTEDVAVVRGSATVAEAMRLMKLRSLHSLVVDRWEFDATTVMDILTNPGDEDDD